MLMQIPHISSALRVWFLVILVPPDFMCVSTTPTNIQYPAKTMTAKPFWTSAEGSTIAVCRSNSADGLKLNYTNCADP